MEREARFRRKGKRQQNHGQADNRHCRERLEATLFVQAVENNHRCEINPGVKFHPDGKAGGHGNYVKGANIAGFVKVANAMLAQGVL